MQRSGVDVSNVHGHLSDAILIDEPADRLAALQGAWDHDCLAVLVLHDLSCDRVALSLRASLLAHVERDCVRAAGRCCVEVIVHGDEEIACAYVGRTGLRCALGVGAWTEVRLACGVSHLLWKSLVLAGTAYRKVLALRPLGCSLIAVAWDLQFIKNALRQLSCQFSALLERNARNRYERKHVSRT